MTDDTNAPRLRLGQTNDRAEAPRLPNPQSGSSSMHDPDAPRLPVGSGVTQ